MLISSLLTGMAEREVDRLVFLIPDEQTALFLIGQEALGLVGPVVIKWMEAFRQDKKSTFLLGEVEAIRQVSAAMEANRLAYCWFDASTTELHVTGVAFHGPEPYGFVTARMDEFNQAGA